MQRRHRRETFRYGDPGARRRANTFGGAHQLEQRGHVLLVGEKLDGRLAIMGKYECGIEARVGHPREKVVDGARLRVGCQGDLYAAYHSRTSSDSCSRLLLQRWLASLRKHGSEAHVSCCRARATARAA